MSFYTQKYYHIYRILGKIRIFLKNIKKHSLMPVFRYNFEKILTKRLRESSNVAFTPKNDPSLPFWP